jgi:hydroxymethylglutaryl-CoA lyase
MNPVLEAASRHGLGVKFYISCSFACPFEGPIDPDRAIDVVYLIGNKLDQGRHQDRGASFEKALIPRVEISISDTIGAATPESVRTLLTRLRTRERDDDLYSPVSNGLSLHFHDTFGRAAECVKAGLDLGIRAFDGSAGGLGGCPYASTPQKRAPGNIATHTLVQTVHAAGYTTGVSLERLEEAARHATMIVGASRLRAAAAPAGGRP